LPVGRRVRAIGAAPARVTTGPPAARVTTDATAARMTTVRSPVTAGRAAVARIAAGRTGVGMTTGATAVARVTAGRTGDACVTAERMTAPGIAPVGSRRGGRAAPSQETKCKDKKGSLHMQSVHPQFRVLRLPRPRIRNIGRRARGQCAASAPCRGCAS
jgi:hypothetical protein